MKKLLTLIVLLTSLSAMTFGQGTCPTKFKRNNGNGSASSCPGVSGTSVSGDVAGTPYAYTACCSSLSKAGEITLSYTSSMSPTFTPVIKRIYQNGTLLTGRSYGPPGPYITGSTTKGLNYCFYGSNLPAANKLTIEYVNPYVDTSYAFCHYTDGDDNDHDGNDEGDDDNGDDGEDGDNDGHRDYTPVITSQPVSQAKCTGSSVTFSVTATVEGGSTCGYGSSSGHTLSYQWRKGTTYITGATNSTYTITGLTTADQGYYSVLVTESGGEGRLSNNVYLTVVNLPNLSNFTSPTSTSPCAGTAATITVNSTSIGSGTFTATYNLSGSNTSTANTATLVMSGSSGTFTIPGTKLATAGTTTVTITAIANGTGCSSTPAASNTASIVVKGAPSISNWLAPLASSPCAGSPSVVTVRSTSLGTGTFTVTYNMTGMNTVTGATATLTMGASTGTFNIPASLLTLTGSTNTVAITSITNSNGCSTAISATNTGTFTVKIYPSLSNLTSLAATSPCVGGAATATFNSTSLVTASYVVTYNLSGANNSTANTATLVQSAGSGVFTIPATVLTTAGSTSYTITSVDYTGCIATISSGNTASFNVKAKPNVTAITTPSATSPCVGAASTVTVASALLGSGTYTVTYNVSGANTSTGNTATLTMGAATGTFTVPSSLLATAGTCSVTLTALSNSDGCSNTVSGVSPAVFTVKAKPNVTNFTSPSATSICVGAASTVTVNSTSLGSGTFNVTYNLSGANSATGNTASLTMSGSTGSFTIPSASLGSTGTTTVTITGIATGDGCSSSVSAANTASFVVNTYPSVTSFGASASSPVVGSASTVTVSSTSLGSGTFNVTYNLSGANTATGNTATLTMSGSTGTFTIPASALGNTGATTVTITSVSNSASCNTTISSGNSASFTVNPALAAITGPTSVLVGNTITLADATSGGTWSSSNTGVATIGTNGVVTGVTTGSVTITYTVGSSYVTYTVTVNPIQPIMGDASVLAGSTITLTDATSGGTWSSSNTGIATIGTNGVVTGVSAGTVTITYTVGGGYVTKTITINPIQPIMGDASVLVGNTITLTDATAGGTWSSSNTGVATISSTGVVTGVTTGTVTITYTVGGAYVTKTITVNPIQPITGESSVLVGNTTTLTDATPGGTWSSSNTGVATISSTGVVTGVTTGTVTLTYTVGGAYVTKTITVNPIQPITGESSVLVGNTTTLTDATPGGTWSSSNTSVATISSTGVVTGVTTGTVTLTYTVGGAYVTKTITVNPIQPITGESSVLVGNTTTLTDATPGGTWSSSNTSVATISSTGVVTGVTTGTVTITYTVGSAYVTKTITVNPIQPIMGDASLLVGSTRTLTDATPGGTWSSSNTSVATIGTNGVITGISAGTVTITYTVGGAYVTKTITVNPIQPIMGDASVLVGNTITLTDATAGGTWTSSNTGVATISSTGVVTGVTSGTVTITYTVGGAYVTKTITINAIQPITGNNNVLVGNTTTLADATSGGTWSSSNTSVATISSTGVLTGVSVGNATITYTVGSAYVTYAITVNPLQPITGSSTVLIGNTTTLTDATPGGTWSSSNTGVATISSTGVVTGVTAGTVTITYTVGGAYVTKTITVDPIQPITGSSTVLVGNTTTLTDATPGGTWSSSNTGVATISSTGVVTGVTTGAVTITYTVGGAYVTYAVAVNPIQPITGPTSTLIGNTITLADATSGGTWTSSNTSVATISSTGVVTGVTVGNVTITYTVGGAYVTYDVAVNPIQPITGPTSTLIGNTITLADATSGGTWSSSNTSVATISSTGVVTGVTVGNVTITYTVGGAYVTYDVAVNPIQPITGPVSTLIGNTITLADATSGGTWSSSNTSVATISSTGVVTGVTVGNVTITYTVGGAYVTYDVAVNPIQPITGPVSTLIGNTITLADATSGGTWSSSNTSVATISSTGVVTGVTVGNVTITYTVGGAYVTYDVAVDPIQPITGPTSTLIGNTITLADATSGGIWSSSNTSVATISSTGVVTGVTVGNVTITYTVGGAYVTYAVAVDPIQPITGPTSTLIGNTITLADATSGGTWSSSNTGVATISSTGVVTGVTVGNVTITYTVGGAYVTYDVAVNPIQPITGPTSTLIGNTITLADATSGGTWTSSNTSVATISSTGVVTGVTVGNVTITYTVGGAYVTYDVAVNPIQPITGPVSTLIGNTITLADATSGGTWTSSNTSVATISSTGVVTGVTVGNVTITYTVGGAYVTYDVAVNPIQPITGPTATLIGNTITLADATSGGTWSSSNTSVATISASGVVTGVTVGNVTITYTVGGAYVTYDVAVNPIQPITGPTSTLIGNTITLADATSGGTWSSSNTSVATISSTGVVTGVTVGNVTITYTVGSAYVTYDVAVNPIQPITGPTSTLIGNTITLADATSGGTWSSSNTGVATISSTGVVTGVTVGNVTITYTVGGAYVTYDVAVDPIQPITGPVSTLIGNTITLADATSGGTWSSSNTGVATISSTGVVTGVTVGNVTITYTVGGAYVTYDVAVNPIQPITGPTSTLIGNTITLADATSGGTWSSSNTSVATISSTGVVTGVTVGNVTITYTVGGAYVTYDVAVNPIQPITGPTSTLIGNTITLADATSGGTWTSSNTSVATISSTGVVTGVTVGNVTITYTVGGAYVTYDVAVDPIQPITGPTSTLVGNTITLADATSGGTWSSSNTGVATISASGVVTGVTVGNVTITYTVGGAYVTYDVAVNPIQPITGPTSTLVGNTITLADATSGGIWSSSNTGVATISSTGVVTGVTVGNVTITYTVGGAYVTYDVAVNPIQPITGPTSTLIGNAITLADATSGGTWSSSNTSVATISSTGVVTGVTVGNVTITYTVGGAYVTYDVAVNPIQPITGPISTLIGNTITLADATSGGTWSSSNNAVATISSTGVVTGVTVGNVTITYTVGGAYVTYDVAVNPIQPITGPVSTLIGNTITLADATSGGTWSSSNTSVATISSTGVVTGITVGNVTITYTVGGAYVTYDVTVNPIQPITGPTSTLIGNTITLADATSGGTWSSSNTGVATISSTGVVTGVTVGNVTITYTVGGAYVTYDVAVNPIQPITGPTSTLIGNTITLADATSGGTWSSSNTSVATISSTGVVTGVTVGNVTITYTVGGAYVTYDVAVDPIQPITGNNNVLIGNTTPLADATPGGTWSSSNTSVATVSATGVLTGVTVGNATITYTVGTAYVVYAVTVDPIQPITGNNNVLIGNTTPLADATPGGTWSSSNTAVATISTTGVLTGVTVGNATITYTVGTAYVVYAITVNPIQPITGNNNVLIGNTAPLADATPGGTWSSSNTSVATISGTGVLTGVTVGNATITYTVGSAYVTYAITVNPIQPITGANTVLEGGQTITLADATSGGTWSSSNTTVATINSTGVVTGLVPGTTMITYTVGSAYVTYAVTVTPVQPITGSHTVLEGNTTTLADVTPGGTWSSSNNVVATINASGVMTGVVPGIATITYTVGTAYVTYSVTVNPIQPITGPHTVLEGGQTITLADATSGGTWTSSNTTVATIGSTGVVTGLVPGTTTITYTVGSAYVTYSVTVTPIQPITGNNNVLIGNTTTLADATSGGTWSSSNNAVATINASGVMTGVTVGNATITYTVGSAYVVYAITVNPIQPITGNNNVLIGNTTPLADATSGGTWSSSNTSVATVSATGVLTGVTVGNATITYTVGTAYVVYAITVNPIQPITGPTSVLKGNTITLADATPGGTWSSSNTAVATIGTGGVLTGVVPGTVTITYTVGAAYVTYTVSVNINLSNFTSPTATTVCLGSNSTVTVNSTSLGAGTYTVTYDLSGANASIGNTATLSMGASTGTFAIPAAKLTNAGTNTVTITGITAASGMSASISTSNTATFNVNANPNLTDFTSPSAVSPCQGSSSTVTVNSTSLGAGTFTVTYNLSGVNSSTGNTATLTMGASNGTFVIPASSLASVGNTTVTITSVSNTSSCSAAIATNNTTTLAVKANPNISSFTTSAATSPCLGAASVVTINSSSLGTGTFTVTYNVSGANASTGNTATLTMGASSGTFSIAATALNNSGSTTVTITSIQNAATCNTNITSNNTATFNVVGVPNAGTITGTFVICPTATTTLTATVAGGTWLSSSPGAATIGLSTGLLTGGSAGTTRITYTVTNSCFSANTTQVVTCNPTASAGTITGTATVCPGATTTLSNTTTGGVWSSGNTAIATVGTGGVVTGVAAGTALITYTVTNSCGTATATKAITVNPFPTVAAITGASTVCVAGTATVGCTTTGGVWSSSNTALATVGTSGIVSGVTAGNVTISYTVTNGCGPTVVTRAMTVNPLPDPGTISGPGTVCVGSTISLTASVSGGTWSSGNMWSASVAVISSVDGGASVDSVGVVTGITASTAPISYTVTNACGSTSAVVNITVNPLPDAGTISGLSTVCEASTIFLSNLSAGGVWSSTNTSVATIGTNGVVTGVTAGTTIISYVVTNSCGSAYATKGVTVNPLPIAGTLSGTATMCAFSSVTLTPSISGGTWSTSMITVATVNSSGLVTGLSGGTANISYAKSNSCGIAYAIQQVTVNTAPATATVTGGGSICPGDVITVSSSLTGGTWSTAVPTVATIDASGVITAVGSGYTPVDYTITNGCGTSTGSIILTVNVVPYAGVISGSSVFCNATTSTYTTTGVGGVWSSSDASILTIDTAGLATAHVPGTATISYMVTNSCGTSLATIPVTINVSPDTIAGPNTIPILGNTISLSNTVAGGAWTSSNLALATVTGTGTVLAIFNGYVNISYTLPNGCFSKRRITIGNPLGGIVGNLSICLGTNSALAAPGSSPGSSWTSSNTSVATIGLFSGVVTPVSIGTSMITFTSLDGSYVTAMVTVNPNPTGLSPASICMQSTYPLSVSPSGGGWTSSNSGVAYVNTANVLTGVVAGTATITYTLETGCLQYATMTVNTIPNVVTGVALTCVGVSTTLSSTSTGCTWSSVSPSIATVNSSGVVTGVGAGTAIISFTNVFGCARQTVVTVNAAASPITGNLTDCVGGNVQLGNTVSGGIWSSSNTAKVTINSTTGSAFGVATGTATVSYATPGGCLATAVVSVNAAPAAITGYGSVLIGTTTQFTHAVSGGTWSSSNISQAFVDATLGNISGLAIGTPTITYTLSEGCFATKPINVVDTGGVITGVKSLCVGTTSALSAPASGGSVWVSSNTAVATIGSTNGVVAGISAGTSIITFTASGSVSMVVVTVMPLPATISGSSTVCALTSTTLSSPGTTGGTWASSNLAIGTIVASTGLFTGRAAGTTTVTYTWTNGCKRTTVETVNPAPNAGSIAGAGSFSVGVSVTLTSSQPGGVWVSANTARATIGSTSGIITGVSPGTVTVSYTNTNSCGSATVTRIFTVLAPRTGAPIAGGGSDMTETPFTLYPNPTSGTFTINAPVTGKLMVFTVDGKLVFTQDIAEPNTVVTMPDDIQTGMYMCRFVGDDGSSQIVKLVVQK